MLWDSWAKAGSVNSNHKGRVSVSHSEVLTRGIQREGHGGTQGDCCSQGWWGSHIRNFHLLVTLRATVNGMNLHEGASVSLRSLETKENECQDSNTMGSLVKFSTKLEVKIKREGEK